MIKFPFSTNYDRVKTIPRVDNQLRTLLHNIGCIASAPSLPSSFTDLVQTTPAEPVLESIHPPSYQASSSIAPAIPPSSSSPPSSSPPTIAAAAASVSSKVESMVPNLRHHVKDYLGSLPGPALVAFGHHHPRGKFASLIGYVVFVCSWLADPIWRCCTRFFFPLVTRQHILPLHFSRHLIIAMLILILILFFV